MYLYQSPITIYANYPFRFDVRRLEVGMDLLGWTNYLNKKFMLQFALFDLFLSVLIWSLDFVSHSLLLQSSKGNSITKLLRVHYSRFISPWDSSKDSFISLFVIWLWEDDTLKIGSDFLLQFVFVKTFFKWTQTYCFLWRDSPTPRFS